MTLGRALSLLIYKPSGETVAAFQSHWYGTVSIAGRLYEFLEFEGSGIFQGHVTGESSTSLEMPATPRIWNLCTQALASSGLWLAQLELWEFPAAGAESLPPASMERIGMTRGQIVGATNDPIHTLKLELGSSISPVGAMIPPRTATTRLIGPGIKA